MSSDYQINVMNDLVTPLDLRVWYSNHIGHPLFEDKLRGDDQFFSTLKWQMSKEDWLMLLNRVIHQERLWIGEDSGSNHAISDISDLIEDGRTAIDRDFIDKVVAILEAYEPINEYNTCVSPKEAKEWLEARIGMRVYGNAI